MEEWFKIKLLHEMKPATTLLVVLLLVLLIKQNTSKNLSNLPRVAFLDLDS